MKKLIIILLLISSPAFAVVRSVTTTYSVISSDTTVKCDATGGSFVITLYKCDSGTADRTIRFQKTDGTANTCTVDGFSAQTVDGAANKILTAARNTITVTCDGTGDWIALGTGSNLTGTIGTSAIADDAITEPKLKMVNSPTDELCLTYESTTGDFEWQSCSSGSGHTIQDESVDLASEPKLNFLGAGVTCADNAGVSTDCTIPGASGITINTTTITGGTGGRILYDNAGTVGELSTLSSFETDLEGFLDKDDLQGNLTLAGDVDGAHGANDLDEASVEAELESVIDLQDLQGAVTDAQVPDTITIAGGTDIAVADGGTGASTAEAARGNLGITNRIGGPQTPTNLSPVDGTNYYITVSDNAGHASGANENATNSYYYAPAGTIIQVCSRVVVNGTLGTTENVTFTVRKNAVNTSMTFTQQWSSASPVVNCATTNTFTVANNDRISLAALAPTWATNPTNVQVSWWLDVRLDQ